MITNVTKHFVNITRTLIIVLSLILAPAVIGNAGAAALNSTPADVGYVDHVYGTTVKEEPTADVAESKLWFNDNIWWGVLYDAAAESYLIHWLDWGTQTWMPTTVEMDNRLDVGELTSVVGTRFDTLWDEDAGKLYVASHIKIANPARFNSDENRARLYRYSYDAVNKTYILDSNFPVIINRDRTEALVIDKDNTGRLWVTYVSRIPTGTIGDVEPYEVYVNYSDGSDETWGTPFKLTSFDATAATVDLHDVSSVIAYSNKVGIMWSNGLTGNFYFAEHSTGSSPTSGWNIVTINPVNLPVGVTLVANDHIKLVANDAGQVFATVKTHNNTVPTPNPDDPLLGIMARDTNGTFSFHQYSTVSSNDTRPSLAYDETDDRLYMFASSSPTGGVICYKTMDVVSPLSDMEFPSGNCSTDPDNPPSDAPHFIRDEVYDGLDNATTSKRNVSASSGLVALASDDVNGGVYLHNTIGSPLAVITGTVPASGATLNVFDNIVKLTFSHQLNPATVTADNITVEGPGGPVAGDVSYNAVSRTVTFTATGELEDGTYSVTLGTALRDSTGRPLYNAGEVLEFMIDAETAVNWQMFMPVISN